MKKQLLLAAITILFALHINAQSYIGGVLSSDTTLSFANSPYIVTNNLLVQEGKKVVVEPGVVFLFNAGIYLQVDGEFQAIGSDGAKIIFTWDSLAGFQRWDGILFTDLSDDYNAQDNTGCILSNCLIEYGEPNSIGSGAMIDIENASPKIEFCNIRNVQNVAIYADGSFSRPTILNNVIHHTSADAILINGDNWGLIQGNEIFDCGGDETISLGNSVFNSNYVHDCSASGIILKIMDTVIVTNNIFENLSQDAAIGLLGGQEQLIKCNDFRNNKINIVITCERHPTVTNNNFWNYQDWNVYWSDEYYLTYASFECHVPYGSGVYATIDLGNNYWGGLTNAQMDASIWDFNDDFSLKAAIAYTPTFPDSVNFSTADCSYSSVGINEVSASNDNMIEIYPNPFHDMSYIRIKSIVLNEKYKVVIFDSYGRMVRQIQVTNPERIQVNRDGLASGMYAYQLISPEKKVYAGKFIVE